MQNYKEEEECVKLEVKKKNKKKKKLKNFYIFKISNLGLKLLFVVD